MNIRQWLSNNPTIATAAVVVLLVVTLGVIYLQTRESRPPAPEDFYFMDLGTMEPFAVDSSIQPPITAPSGEDGVLAHLFTCGECSADEWFGYLNTYVGEAKQLVETGYHPGDRRAMEVLRENHMIRALDGEQWVPYQSDAGQRIENEVRSRCDGNPTRCRPE